MLAKGQEALPDTTGDKGRRFEIDKVKGHIEGNQTVISNFKDIANSMDRDPEHMLKFVLNELAVPGEFKRNKLSLGSKISSSKINKKIRQYAGEYVFCPKCGKPDTELRESDEAGMHLRCKACGHESPVKKL